MNDEAMRAAFEAWCDDQGYVYEEYCFQAWQAATQAERRRFAEIWENDAAQAAFDYANGHPVNWTAGAEKIREGEMP